MKLKIALLTLVSIVVQATVNPETLFDSNTIAPCITFANGSQVFGCTSFQTSGRPADGVVVHIDHLSLFQAQIRNLPSISVVLPFSQFTFQTYQDLVANYSQNLHAIIIPFTLDSWSAASGSSYQVDLFSDVRFRFSSSQAESQLEMFERRFNVPVTSLIPTGPSAYALVANLSAALSANYASGFSTFPLYFAQVSTTFYSKTVSEICLRRSLTAPRAFCYPVGGYSIVSTFDSTTDPLKYASTAKFETTKPLIWVSAPFDDQAIFNDLAIGANYFTSSAVSLLLVASAIDGSYVSSMGYSMVYSLFNTESFELSGSMRFVQSQTLYDIGNTAAFFELGALIPADNGSQAYVAYYNSQTAGTLATRLSGMGNFTAVPFTATFDNVKTLLSFPSSATTAFTNKNASIPFVYVTSETDPNPLTWKRLYSPLDAFYDNGTYPSASQMSAICTLSNQIVQTIYATLGAGNQTRPSVNCTLGAELFSCLAYSFNCDLVKRYMDWTGETSLMKLAGSYAGNTTAASNYVRFLRKFLNAALTTPSASGNSCKLDTDCAETEICSKFQCYVKRTAYFKAFGTGIDENDSAQLTANGKSEYVRAHSTGALIQTRSSWTVSMFSELALRIYQKEQGSTELGQFFGSLIFTVAFTGASFYYIRLNKIFDTSL